MLQHISIKNYKNIEKDISFESPITLIVAENGQGKTNILEAIYYVTNGFDFQKTSDFDSINFSSSDKIFQISARYSLSSKNNSATVKELTFQKKTNTSKKFKVDDKSKSQVEFGRYSKAIVFAPESIDLVSGSAEIRRLEIDHFCSLYFEKYSRLLIEFRQTLKSRNKQMMLLQKRYGMDIENAAKDQVYKFWTSRFIDLSDEIVKFRLEILQLLNDKCKNISHIYHFDENKFDLIYEFKSLEVIDDYKTSLHQKIEESLLKELMRGTSLYGPHRDDVSVKLNNKLLREYGSRGQQRIASFMIKHAETEILETSNLDNASDNILLLDDLPSELDSRHLQNIENLLLEMKLQIIMTSTSTEHFSKNFLEKVKIIEI